MWRGILYIGYPESERNLFLDKCAGFSHVFKTTLYTILMENNIIVKVSNLESS